MLSAGAQSSGSPHILDIFTFFSCRSDIIVEQASDCGRDMTYDYYDEIFVTYKQFWLLLPMILILILILIRSKQV